MTGLEALAVLLAGLGSGVVVSTVGVASLISFPVLLAVGLPPVVANASNTVGLAPAGLSGSIGYRDELRTHPKVTLAVLVTCAIGAVAGAALLLTMPPGVFEVVVPWLILAACLVVGLHPLIARGLARHLAVRDADEPLRLSPATTALAVLTGVYAGYFGAGAGVMMLALLALGLDLDLRLATALKTLSILVCSVVAGVVFVVAGDLDWTAIGLLAAGGVVGGYAGARVGRRLPETLLRVLVVASGVVAATVMLTR